MIKISKKLMPYTLNKFARPTNEIVSKLAKVNSIN